MGQRGPRANVISQIDAQNSQSASRDDPSLRLATPLALHPWQFSSSTVVLGAGSGRPEWHCAFDPTSQRNFFESRCLWPLCRWDAQRFPDDFPNGSICNRHVPSELTRIMLITQWKSLMKEGEGCLNAIFATCCDESKSPRHSDSLYGYHSEMETELTKEQQC